MVSTGVCLERPGSRMSLTARWIPETTGLARGLARNSPLKSTLPPSPEAVWACVSEWVGNTSERSEKDMERAGESYLLNPQGKGRGMIAVGLLHRLRERLVLCIVVVNWDNSSGRKGYECREYTWLTSRREPIIIGQQINEIRFTNYGPISKFAGSITAANPPHFQVLFAWTMLRRDAAIFEP